MIPIRMRNHYRIYVCWRVVVFIYVLDDQITCSLKSTISYVDSGTTID